MLWPVRPKQHQWEHVLLATKKWKNKQGVRKRGVTISRGCTTQSTHSASKMRIWSVEKHGFFLNLGMRFKVKMLLMGCNSNKYSLRGLQHYCCAVALRWVRDFD